MTNRPTLPLKAVLLIAGILITVIPAFAQSAQVAKSFEQNKANYTREHFASGEDASSGYDYLFYKSRAKIVKVRSIWSASYTKELRIEDLYFNGDAIVLLRRLSGNKGQLRALIKGQNLPLVLKDELNFAESKLVSWTDDRRSVLRTDPRWDETEKATVEHANAVLESYQWLKENK